MLYFETFFETSRGWGFLIFANVLESLSWPAVGALLLTIGAFCLQLELFFAYNGNVSEQLLGLYERMLNCKHTKLQLQVKERPPF